MPLRRHAKRRVRRDDDDDGRRRARNADDDNNPTETRRQRATGAALMELKILLWIHIVGELAARVPRVRPPASSQSSAQYLHPPCIHPVHRGRCMTRVVGTSSARGISRSPRARPARARRVPVSLQHDGTHGNPRHLHSPRGRRRAPNRVSRSYPPAAARCFTRSLPR